VTTANKAWQVLLTLEIMVEIRSLQSRMRDKQRAQKTGKTHTDKAYD
jgi:hypothetical protein